MITRTMKWISMVALAALLPLLWTSPLAPTTLLVAVLVWGGALVVLMQAVSTGRYLWAGGFAFVVLAFNPVLPLTLSRGAFVAIDLLSMTAFLSSLMFLKSGPRLSMVSVTDTAPRSEAL
jgi:hypothetical protein